MLENEHPSDKNLLYSVNKVFLFLILLYLPVSELFIHTLESYTSYPDKTIFWFSHFYEPVVVLLIVSNFIIALFKKKLAFTSVDIVAVAFLLWTLVCVFIHPSEMQRGLESLRFTALPFIFYLFARLSNCANAKKIALFYVGVAGLISTVGVVEYFFLPANWLTSYFGISNFGFGQNALVSTNQASSFLAGPNQLASYLIFPLFYALHRAVISKKLFKNWSTYYIAPITLALILTFSRSAILGTALGVIIFFITLPKESRPKIPAMILFFAVAFAFVVSYVMYFGGTITDLLTHGASSVQHASSTEMATKTALGSNASGLILGRGIGTAGPAALKFGGYMPENYYLQILFETGIIGLLLFAGFFVFALKKFFRGSKVLFAVIVALLVNAFFLHIFSDNPAMAVSVFILMAVAISTELKTKAVGYSVRLTKN
jgi:O-antigen ligase